MTVGVFDEEPYDFPPTARATVPGGPAHPPEPEWKRPLFFGVGLLLGVSGGLGNALVSTNLPYLLGSLGAQSDQAAWIPTAYSMSYVGMNLLLVRARQQFGLRRFAMVALMAFCAVTFAHLFVHGFEGAIVVHAAAGFVTAPMTTLSVYYLMTGLRPAVGYRGVLIGLGLTQIPTPLVRIFSTDLLQGEQWRSLYAFELGLALLCLGSVALLRLPPSERINAYEKLDFVSYPLLAGGLALVCAVLGLGESAWWFDRAWLGWALTAAILLAGAGFYIEANRARPLIDLQWLTGANFLRFIVVVGMSRIVLAEQNTSAFACYRRWASITTNSISFPSSCCWRRSPASSVRPGSISPHRPPRSPSWRCCSSPWPRSSTRTRPI